jgi:hypothetical protein
LDDETDPIDETPDAFLFVWACGFELAIGIIGLVLASIIGVDARAYLPRLNNVDWSVIGQQFAVGAAASIPMILAIAVLMRVPHESIRAIKRLSDSPTMKALLGLSNGELLVLSVCAGVGEELAFRGFLLPWLTAMHDPAGAVANPFEIGESFQTAVPGLLVSAIVISSIAFGLLHPITKLYVFVAALMGVYFGVLMVLTDSLLVPIVTHAVYDAAQFLMAKRELASEQEE